MGIRTLPKEAAEVAEHLGKPNVTDARWPAEFLIEEILVGNYMGKSTTGDRIAQLIRKFDWKTVSECFQCYFAKGGFIRIIAL